jgi:predicted PurR-regulated permease PerM
MSEPESSPQAPDATSTSIRTAVEVAIRLGVIALLVGWCLIIIAPFLRVVVWALIIAIAFDRPFETICRALGGRKTLTATIGVVAILLLLFVPVVTLSETLISGAQNYAAGLEEGALQIPPPDPGVKDWPVIGSAIYSGWLAASENVDETLARLAPQLRTASRWLLAVVGSVGVGILELIASVLIAGVMLVRSETRKNAISRFSERMAGQVQGPRLVELANATVRSVVQGILGVAALQSLLAGAGFLVAGIPGAGLWAALVLVLAVVQIPVLVAMIAPVLIGFSMLGSTGAWALLIWCGAIGLVDNVLRPIFFSRGVKVPTLVIFMGAIGGMLTMGLVGLFLGAVVLALGFELLMAWLSESQSAPETGATAPVHS